MTDLELLQQARTLIEHPEHWTRDTLARDAYGAWTGCRDRGAAAWCAVGAVYNVCGGAHRPAADRLCATLDDVARRYFGWTGVSSLNDFLGHSAALKAYDIAIREMACAPAVIAPAQEAAHA